MKIECSNCKKIYNIPEERLPKDQSFAFPCQACKTVVEIDLRSVLPEAAGSDPTEPNHPVGDELKKKILKTVRDLPPMPQTVFKAREIMADPNSGFDTLARVLETDPAIATKILQLANSAYYGFVGKISSIQHATMVLGHKTLNEIVTMAGSLSVLGNEMPGYGLDPGELWQHSLGVAFASKMIARKKEPALEDDSFAAGLIHDMGKLVLDKYVVERRTDFQHVLLSAAGNFLAAEKQALGFDHAEIAAELCKNWNIPDSFAVAIRYHHQPSRSGESKLAHIIHMADVITLMSGIGTGIDGMQYSVDPETMPFLQLGEEDIPSLIAEVVESVQKVSEEVQKKD
ncbi:MAG: HDOD domain-containing protein [Desulfobacteraceae bacterium]|nr:MAG: HDOD domain-containing protein [Desulfobacteraceae bacterium]